MIILMEHDTDHEAHKSNCQSSLERAIDTERIFDGLSLEAKERGFGADLVRKYEDLKTKIYLPQVRNLARPVLGLARPCHTPELLLLLLLRF
ncbi:hypothetical protein MTR_0351s0020 [Medicago truncatula]|uniref:Uncharacterized protein n=1 Tax=Medicago truncatula TaxID=3880 RepID=A0A072TFA6_MEDTR|nr:hypothetical protein MTR_0351s0020 [Medicago truncatula]